VRSSALIAATLIVISFAWGCVINTEEAKYQVVSRADKFEIRDYAPHVVAETVVEGNLEDAGGKAFSRLFDFISGKNRSHDKIAMTAPVSQKLSSEKIKMTSPVGQQRIEGGWVVSFTMPSSKTIESLPAPEDHRVKLRQVPACRMAAVRYSGIWSEERYIRYKLELETWIEKKGLKIIGEAVWARYNPPFTPWFLRRNEILIPVNTDSE
jgi:effector-binding domain-containing protein